MYLYLILGAAFVLRNELFKLFSHLIPLTFSGIRIAIVAIFKHGGKGMYRGGKMAARQIYSAHHYTYQKIGQFDNYMMTQPWRR
ncbi:MAG TPA: hypothetical protein VGE63_02810 [Candidatus Paceibacterota bacterium]